ncbi:transglutaminase-like domain-containing protein [Candidatus Methylobacter oryzae]|uniref:Transglutaminase domain-containing protein n=1 Tax=Candidatus Methylobacter oryzae TaxID=2497749 RepID=A0ABY3C9D1_9GAMM|nr:transglutaminase domain-containing protein [Candidatus Methylobacter oryzae]TRW94231.1 transglutaminase domain-containing protein [Candidatus Methylobacter oryzae]
MMNKDLLFLSFSLLSWGWLSETWPAAFGLLFAIVAGKYSAWRWQISSTQFYRCGDLSALLVILLLIDVYILQPTERPIFVLLKWLPVLFAPALFAQLFSSAQSLPLATLFYSLRKQNPELADFKLPYTSLYNRESGVIRLFREIDFIQPYAALTVLSAGAANVQSPLYFIIATALFTGILWTIRPKHSSVPLWLLSIVLAIGVSYFGYQGLRQLHTLVEEKSIAWLSNWQSDPFKGQTSIGDVGELKLSDKIEFRLKADGPLLLHQASYDLYLGHSWLASKHLFMPENPFKPSENGPLKQLEILQQLNRQSVLALPDGTVKITGLDDAYLQYTELGAVKANLSPRFARYQAFYTDRRTGAPSKYDLLVPKQHLDWLQQIADELKLAGQRPETIVELIKSHFQHNFFYSLYLGNQANADLALRDFMLKRKAGHCEYFAAATVLLLRQAGIPARLANGYSVGEYDNRQDLYIVRSRHAHAWAIAYIDGLWRAVDSTPSQWLAMESEHASLWQPVADWWSNCLFHFREWQLQQSRQQNAKLELIAALLLTIYLAWRLYSAKQKLSRKTQNKQSAMLKPCCQGLDSEFYLIEQGLQNTDRARLHNESIQEWVERLQAPELSRLYKLHYQLRFDPLGLSDEQRQLLRQQANAWLEHFRNEAARH